MINRLILVLTIVTAIYNQSFTQNLQIAHQLTQSSYIGTDGKVITNPGGHITTSESENVFLLDSLHGNIYDTVSAAFKNNKRVSYTYDAGGLLMESTSQSLDKSGTVWGNSQNSGYKYTGSQLFEETFRGWDKTLTDWTNLSKNKYSYEADNSLSSIFYLPWAGDSLQWEYSTKDLISYNTNATVSSSANQKWNKNLGSWENYQLIKFTYSGGLVSEMLYQVWNKPAQQWEDYQKEDFTYSNSKISEIVTQSKSASTNWENYSRKVFTYSNDLPDNITEYYWFGSWKENRKSTYAYNTNSLVSSITIAQWADPLNSFRNASMDEMYWSQHLVYGIGETAVNTFIVNSPLSKQVPFTPGGLQPNVKYQLKLVSLNGITVMSKPVVAGQSVLVGNQISNGIYVIVLTAHGSKPVSQKVLITD